MFDCSSHTQNQNTDASTTMSLQKSLQPPTIPNKNVDTSHNIPVQVYIVFDNHFGNIDSVFSNVIDAQHAADEANKVSNNLYNSRYYFKVCPHIVQESSHGSLSFLLSELRNHLSVCMDDYKNLLSHMFASGQLPEPFQANAHTDIQTDIQANSNSSAVVSCRTPFFVGEMLKIKHDTDFRIWKITGIHPGAKGQESLVCLKSMDTDCGNVLGVPISETIVPLALLLNLVALPIERP